MNDGSIHPATFRDRIPPFLTGLIFFIIGLPFVLIFGTMGSVAFFDKQHLKEWPEVAAVVESSQALEKAPGKYKFTILYRYSFQGSEFHSHHLRGIQDAELLDFAEAQSLVSQYPAGSTITAHVNPIHPNSALVTAGNTSYFFFIPFVIGLIFTYIGISFIWRSTTAFCIIRKTVEIAGRGGSGIRFYFYDSLEAAQKASEWTPMPDTETIQPSPAKARIQPIIYGIIFACIGIAGLVLLFVFNHYTDGITKVVLFIILSLFTVMGIGLARSAATAKYVVDRKGGFGQEEISFYNSKEDLQKAQQIEKDTGFKL